MSDSRRLRADSGVLHVKGRTYSAREVFQAADFRGELRSRWREFVVAVARARAAEDLDLTLDGEALQALSEEFRYERDLVTAEETEKWLEDRGATLEDFDEYFLRRYWARELRDAPPPTDVDRPWSAHEPDEAFGIDLMLSGEFFRMAARLGRRVLAVAAAGENGGPPREAIERERARFTERSGIRQDGIRTWLSAAGTSPASFDELLRLEAVYAEYCRTLLGDQARTRVLRAMRLPLTRLEVETIEVDSLDAAREAALCVSDDGIEMADLAKEQRYPYRKTDVLLEDLDEDRQTTLLAASPGDVLKPINNEGRFEVCRLVRKVEPALSDEKVANRIGESILDAHFAELTREEIRWLIPDETAA